jgi:hypothetical protein
MLKQRWQKLRPQQPNAERFENRNSSQKPLDLRMSRLNGDVDWVRWRSLSWQTDRFFKTGERAIMGFKDPTFQGLRNFNLARKNTRTLWRD